MGELQPKIALVLVLLLLLILPLDTALAQRRGLFLLSDLRQKVDFNYQYDGQESSSDRGPTVRSRQQRFEEIYHVAIRYALYDPQLLKGNFAAAGKLSQETFVSSGGSSGNGHSTDFEYSLDGILLSRKPYPVNFFSRYETSFVVRQYSPGYDLTSDSNGVGVALNNSYVPMQFSYSRTTSETSGLLADRQETTEYYLASFTNNFREISRSELSLARYLDNSTLKGGGDLANSRTDDLSFTNNLAWTTSGKRRSLYSFYRFREETGNRDERLSIWQESLNWDLGLALKSGLDYWRTRRRSASQIQEENQGRAWLEHQLFRSLTTRVSFLARQTDESGGREQFTSGTVQIGYQKELPAQGRLQFEFAQSLDITDRNLKDAQLTSPEEAFTASIISPYRLLHPNTIAGTIILRNASPTNLHFTVPYVLNADYTLNQVGAFTEIQINPGGEVVDGVDKLVVAYDYLENPDIKYETSSRRVGGSLSLLDNRYRFYGSVEDSRQEVLAGRPELLQLNNYFAYRLGMETNLADNSLGCEYVNVDATLDRHQSLEAFWRHARDLGRGSLSVRINDRYTMYEEVSAAPGSIKHSENLATAHAVYRRPISDLALLRIKADYAKTSGGGADRDDIGLGLTLQMRVNKFLFNLISQVNWQKTSATLNRNDLVRLEMSRFF